MKRMVLAIISCLLLTTIIPSDSATEPPIQVVHNGISVKMAPAPVLEKNTVLAPAKGLLEVLGASYTWEAASKSIVIKKANHIVRMQVGSSQVRVNQEEEFMDAPAKLIKNTLFIPAQFTCELFGSALSYNSKSRTVYIKNSFNNIKTMELPVGTIKNDIASGSWWGENISKVTRTSKALFTFALDSSSGQRKAVLMQRKMGESWTEGQSFNMSRPPNILSDSKGYIHVIGFEPFDTEKDSAGRLIHIQFENPHTVAGNYKKTYLTSEDIRSNKLTLENFATYFNGASIGSDDTIFVAYENSTQKNLIGTFSIGARIYDPKTQQWVYETVSQNMNSKYAYPFTFVSEKYYHVFAIEDMPDPDYANLTAQHQAYQFRYGAVKHFQRLRTGGSWEETTLLNFNDNPNISKQQIGDSSLRILDFTVDSNNIVHAIIRYNGKFEDNRLTLQKNANFSHYWKAETSNSWQSEFPKLGIDAYWVKLWEHKNKTTYFIASSNTGLYLMPLGTTNLYMVSKYINETGSTGPTPFFSNKRSSGTLNDELNVVIYAAKTMGVSKLIDIKIQDQFEQSQIALSTKTIFGTLSLPKGKVAPKGGLPVAVLASTLELGAFPIATKLVIPEGENSVPYTLKLNSPLRYRIWYDLQMSGSFEYKNWGVYTPTGMIEYIKKGTLLDIQSDALEINLQIF